MSISRNSTYNIVGTLVPVGLSLLLIPLYVSQIGLERYGIISIVWLMLGYFGLFDLGMGRAVAQRIASQEKSAPQTATVFWSALAVNGVAGIIGGISFWALASWYFEAIPSSAYAQELRPALPLLIAAVPVITLSGVCSGALQGQQLFFMLNVVSIFGAALLQVIPLGVAYFFSPDLSNLILASLATRALTLLVLFATCAKGVLSTSKIVIRRDAALDMMKFGGWITISSVISPIMPIIDRALIGSILGPTAVALYTIPYQITSRISLVPRAVTSALYPRLASGSPLTASATAVAMTRRVADIITVPSLIGILAMPSFLEWWVGEEVASGATLPGQILILGFWINGLSQIPYTLLQATDRPKIVAMTHLLELPPYIVGILLCVTLFGLPGAAFAFAIRALADGLLLAKSAGILRSMTRSVAFSFAALFVSIMSTANADRLDPALYYVSAIGILLACAVTTAKRNLFLLRRIRNR